MSFAVCVFLYVCFIAGGNASLETVKGSKDLSQHVKWLRSTGGFGSGLSLAH